MSQPNVLLTGIAFGEPPRWYDGRLWFSDFGAQELNAVDLQGNRELVAHVAGSPMGLGFLPDGRLLIVSMNDGLLLRRDHDGSMVVHADLTQLSPHPWNDLVVDGRGNAYVGNMGVDFPQGECAPGMVALVTADGSVVPVADDFAFPNGMVITPDNATLIIAESYASRLTAFEIDAAGTLSNRRVWADLDQGTPDGICLDADGAVWFADVPAKRCVRVREGGEILETVDLDRGCFACTLGGTDRSTLFLLSAIFPPASWGPDAARTGQVVTVDISVAGAGWP